MCYAWVPYAAAAIAAAYGAKTQADATNDAAQRQQDAINAALTQQDQWARKAEQKALENADEYDMTKRAERLEDAKEAAGESLAQSLVKSREEISTPAQASGKLSDSFIADRSSKLAQQFQDSVDMARLMGRVRGVNDMLNDEALTNANYASDLATISRNAKGDYSAAQPGIVAAGKVDSGQMALGGFAQGLGTAYLSGGLGDAFGTASTAGADVGNGLGNANLLSSPSLSNAAKYSKLNLMG
jgi:hypothetical protein